MNYSVTPPPTGFLHAPIIHKIYDFYVLSHQCLRKFSRFERYTLGETIQGNNLQIIEIAIFCATTKSQIKQERLISASIKLDLSKLLIRLAYDTKSINYQKYIQLEEKLQEIGRMLGGWIKSTHNS